MNYHQHYQEILEVGASVIPGFLSQEQIEALRLRAHSCLFKLDKQHRAKFRSTGSMCHFADHPEFADLISDPKILQVLKGIGATDPKWLSGYLISKPAGGPPLFWHQDWWGWQHEVSYQPEPLALFFMIYLTDTKPQNGCLRVIPGSHQFAHELHSLPDAHGETLAGYANPNDPAYAEHKDQVNVEIKAGDLLIGDSRLLHGAFANNSESERPLLISWYIPNFSALPESIQARYQQIYLRQELDLDTSSEPMITTEDWPSPIYQYVKSLVPQYHGDQTLEPWLRKPTISRMKVK